MALKKPNKPQKTLPRLELLPLISKSSSRTFF